MAKQQKKAKHVWLVTTFGKANNLWPTENYIHATEAEGRQALKFREAKRDKLTTACTALTEVDASQFTDKELMHKNAPHGLWRLCDKGMINWRMLETDGTWGEWRYDVADTEVTHA